MSARVRRPAAVALAAFAAIAAHAVAVAPARGASAEDDGASGISVWADLLNVAGHRVDRVDRPPSLAGLYPETTAILIDPGRLRDRDETALATFLRSGGRLVLGGQLPAATVAAITGLTIETGVSRGGRFALPVTAAPETDEVSRVRVGGSVSFTNPGPLRPLIGRGTRSTVLAGPIGDGMLILLADATPVRNRGIGIADNARLALNLAGEGSREVVFVGPARGSTESGLGAVPDRWWFVGGGLLLAAFALVAARIRRLGPASSPPDAGSPPRRAYVDAVAALLARAGKPEEAIVPLRAAARRRVRERAGIVPGSIDPDIVKAAESWGVSPDDTRWLSQAPKDEREFLEAGRSLARTLARR